MLDVTRGLSVDGCGLGLAVLFWTSERPAVDIVSFIP